MGSLSNFYDTATVLSETQVPCSRRCSSLSPALIMIPKKLWGLTLMGTSVITPMWRFPSDTSTELHCTLITLSLKLPFTDGFNLMGTITEAEVKWGETGNFTISPSMMSEFYIKKRNLALLHIKIAHTVGAEVGGQHWLAGTTLHTHRTAAMRPLFLCFAFCLPLQQLHITHQSSSLRQPSVPREPYSLSSSQSELTPRPFSNCPGMFSGAQSNWTVTITNGWFAAARRCNVALNERKHAHQFHTVANTILLWVIVVGHFSFKVLPSLGKSSLAVCLCVCMCRFPGEEIINL